MRLPPVERSILVPVGAPRGLEPNVLIGSVRWIVRIEPFPQRMLDFSFSPSASQVWVQRRVVAGNSPSFATF